MTPGVLGNATFDHVGIAAESADTPLVRQLGGLGDLIAMPSGVSVGRFGADRAIELVTAHQTGSPIERFLANRGPGLHHVALRVDEPLEDLLPRLAEEGLDVVGPIAPSSDGRPSVFLHPSSTGGVLVELVEGGRPADGR